MAWVQAKDTPVFEFVKRLSKVCVKSLQLQALQDTHRQILQMKSAAYSAKRDSDESRLEPHNKRRRVI